MNDVFDQFKLVAGVKHATFAQWYLGHISHTSWGRSEIQPCGG